MTMTTTTTATTSFGRLRGAVDNGVVVFRGIPYAQPPLGPLRFAPPVRPKGWSGTRSAERFGPAPMQPANPVNGRSAPGECGEDCLYLNVWTPGVDDQRRPVMVWFHGGAFLFGDRRTTAWRMQARMRSGLRRRRAAALRRSPRRCWRVGQQRFPELDMLQEAPNPLAGVQLRRVGGQCL